MNSIFRSNVDFRIGIMNGKVVYSVRSNASWINFKIDAGLTANACTFCRIGSKTAETSDTMKNVF